MKSYATNVPVHETVKYINTVSLQTPKVSGSCPACSSISIKLSTLSVQAYTHFISTRLYTLHSITNWGTSDNATTHVQILALPKFKNGVQMFQNANEIQGTLVARGWRDYLFPNKNVHWGGGDHAFTFGLEIGRDNETEHSTNTNNCQKYICPCHSYEKAQIHTLNKSTEIFDPVESKRRYKFIILYKMAQ